MDDDASRRRPITAAQWRAARAISECAPATRDKVAAILGCGVRAVFARSAAESWRTPDWRQPAVKSAHRHFVQQALGEGADGLDLLHADGSPESPEPDGASDGAASQAASAAAAEPSDAGDDPREMLSRGARFLSRRLSRLMRQAERGGQISKQEIDNLTAMTRMMDRWETLAKERAKQEEADQDAKIAEALRKIDRRILKLAREEAERLVAARDRQGDRARDQ